jgi:hypothetical protein
MTSSTRWKWTAATTAILAGALVVAALIWPDGSPRADATPTGAHVTIPAVSPVQDVVADLLPDLDQEVPSELEVQVVAAPDGTPSHRIGFRSAVRNLGAGPLLVDATRPDTSVPTMTVDQLVERTWGAPRVVAHVGRMQYSISPDHSHWHYLQFERYELQQYELRRAGSADPIVADRKTGFCLGDRYRATATRLPAAPPEPVYTGSCGVGQPELLEMREGISVGYGDDYSAFLEGQDLPLDGLADGRYVLVHRVNVDRRLHELSYANNSSSVLLDVHWVNGAPEVQVVASCPDTDQCEA